MVTRLHILSPLRCGGVGRGEVGWGGCVGILCTEGSMSLIVTTVIPEPWCGSNSTRRR